MWRSLYLLAAAAIALNGCTSVETRKSPPPSGPPLVVLPTPIMPVGMTVVTAFDATALVPVFGFGKMIRDDRIVGSMEESLVAAGVSVEGELQNALVETLRQARFEPRP